MAELAAGKPLAAIGRVAMRHMILRSVLLAALAGAAGCSGELPPILPKTKDASAAFDQGWRPPDLGRPLDHGAPRGDGASSQDGSPTRDGSSTKDKGAPKPDTTAPRADLGAGVGGPCPCLGGAQCIEGVCRGACAPPTDPCKVESACPAQHGCIKSADGVYVCIPASPPGTACPASAFPPIRCPTKHVCGSVNNGPFMCLPTCGSNADCKNGFCAPTATACKICSAL